MTYPEDDKTLTEERSPAGAAGPHGSSPLLGRVRELYSKIAAGQAVGVSGAPGPVRPEVPRAGDYQLGDALGVGGFGVVYRAEHVQHRTPAAVKIPHPELADTPASLARFEREIEAIRRLRHPNVVEIFDVGRLEDGRPYFAMLTGAGAAE
jgi:eukaryotic-like serine/threonine-protein kinase